MHKKQFLQNTSDNETQKQRGQSMVLIALALVGILAFAGIAVDTGFTFARSSQLQAAVDAAVLAAVTEVININDLTPADTKAGQFLNTNNVPISTTVQNNGVPITTIMTSQAGISQLGATEYTLTVTWPVEHYFLKLIGFESTQLTKSATAAYFPLADIYASRRVDTGVLGTSNQSLFGPNSCTDNGDPFSPFVRTWANSTPPDWEPYSYHYRILIPDDYPSDILRIELFDPDSINKPGETHNYFHSAGANNSDPLNYPLGSQSGDCDYGFQYPQKHPCLIETGEADLINPTGTPPIERDQVNSYWYIRVDENRGHGPGHGDQQCYQRVPYTERYNTATQYRLFYWVKNSDGSITKTPLASYTGQTGDYRDGANPGGHETDMRWVSPGGTPLDDDISRGLPAVPVDTGSLKDFELSISQDLPGILTDPSSGNRYVYLDIQAISGASENGFEIWAGPLYTGVSSDVNIRNLQVLKNPSSHLSQGVSVFGMGRLPLNSNIGADPRRDNVPNNGDRRRHYCYDGGGNYQNPPVEACNAIDIPLIYVGPEMAGQSVFVSLYDSDAGAIAPITFFFDSVSEDDWSMTFGAGDPDPDGISGRCRSGYDNEPWTNGFGCWSKWVTPPYNITVPGDTDRCDWNNPTQEDCTPFYGGRLIARYIGGNNDTYGWQITIEGLPYLTK